MGLACKGEVLQTMDEWGRKGACGIWLDSGKGTAGKAVGPWPGVGESKCSVGKEGLACGYSKCCIGVDELARDDGSVRARAGTVGRAREARMACEAGECALGLVGGLGKGGGISGCKGRVRRVGIVGIAPDAGASCMWVLGWLSSAPTGWGPWASASPFPAAHLGKQAKIAVDLRRPSMAIWQSKGRMV